MSRNQYLDKLNKSLGKMPLEEKNDILYDYKEHFNIGLEAGKSEEDIIKSLGDPNQIAKLHKADYFIKKAGESHTVRNISKAIFAAFGLGFLNIVFMLGPFLAICGLYLGVLASACLLIIGGILTILSIFLPFLLPDFLYIPLNPGVTFLASATIISLGFLLLIGCIYSGNILYRGTIGYLKLMQRLFKMEV